MGKFELGSPFGRFDCTYEDVCSRVYHLVKESYIAHSPTNQQMLVYVPEVPFSVLLEQVSS